MAAKAFILIETVVGRTKQVASTLQQLKGVKSADCVTGPYDVIAVVEGENLDDYR
jgi:DNA-binding Lrp family transcriptional regulator